jgi:hypothetical protein
MATEILIGGILLFIAEFVYLCMSIKGLSNKPKYGIRSGLQVTGKPTYKDVDRLMVGDPKTIPGTKNKKLLEFEYAETQKMLQHYDNLNWQVGSILVGSSILAMGFITQSSLTTLVAGASIGGMVALFIWALWVYRHTALYNVKYDRLYMIEQMLGFAQHRMVGYAGLKGVNWLGDHQLTITDLVLVLWGALSIVWLLILASIV